MSFQVIFAYFLIWIYLSASDDGYLFFLKKILIVWF